MVESEDWHRRVIPERQQVTSKQTIIILPGKQLLRGRLDKGSRPGHDNQSEVEKAIVSGGEEVDVAHKDARV